VNWVRARPISAPSNCLSMNAKPTGLPVVIGEV
jgi:hypothetical protein